MTLLYYDIFVAVVCFVCQGLKSDCRFEALILTDCCDVMVIISSYFRGECPSWLRFTMVLLYIEAHPGIIP
jgi:hypothetical protein